MPKRSYLPIALDKLRPMTINNCALGMKWMTVDWHYISMDTDLNILLMLAVVITHSQGVYLLITSAGAEGLIGRIKDSD
jgi:hypothetical protein